jgi:transcription initiation factor TFIID subunit 7
MAPDKPTKSERRDDGGIDLETQFILRLPEEPSQVLREAIQSGQPNLRERFSISLENDLRKGMVRLDDRYLYAKVVDLPCVIESMKTIDKKSFYKTADVCQMVSFGNRRSIMFTK